MNRVRTAIFPVAGLGTRFMPATKGTPKELLPVIDTPLIQYAIDEARDAGIERMIFVSHPSKSAIERYVMQDEDLVETLRERGKHKIAKELDENALDEAKHDIVFVMQNEPLGLGHAVLCAREHVLDGPVAVILPDDLMLCSGDGCLAEMLQAYATGAGGHMIAVMEVDPDEVTKYGVLSVTRRDGNTVHADGMVEKPAPKEAPSQTAVIGRYVLDPSIFDALETQSAGAGGEIQLTDAIARGIGEVGLVGCYLSGQRFDCGSKAGMLAATLHVASQHDEFSQVLSEFASGRNISAAA